MDANSSTVFMWSGFVLALCGVGIALTGQATGWALVVIGLANCVIGYADLAKSRRN